jgi:hypothetical protein
MPPDDISSTSGFITSDEQAKQTSSVDRYLLYHIIMFNLLFDLSIASAMLYDKGT